MIFNKHLIFLLSIFVGLVSAASKQSGSSGPPHSDASIRESEKKMTENSRIVAGHVHGAINSGVPVVRDQHVHAANQRLPARNAATDDYAQKTKENLAYHMQNHFGGNGSGSKQ